MTPRKKWPHEVDWARLDCIGKSAKVRSIIVKLSDRIDDPIILRQFNNILEDLRDIEELLKECKGENNHG